MNDVFKSLKHRTENEIQRICDWDKLASYLNQNLELFHTLSWMEETGGEIAVIKADGDEIWIADCAKESPIGRRSLCYDAKARKERKKNAPEMSAVEQAEFHNLKIMDEKEYRFLQEQRAVDEKTSSWIKTPYSIRELGGALFCERRYQQVFTFHNSASSYYASRGWRGLVKIVLEE